MLFVLLSTSLTLCTHQGKRNETVRDGIVTVTFDNGETRRFEKVDYVTYLDSGNVILEMSDKSPRIVYSNDSLRSLEYEDITFTEEIKEIGNKVEVSE